MPDAASAGAALRRGVSRPVVLIAAAVTVLLLAFAHGYGYHRDELYVRAVRSAGLRTAVVSSSANCAEVLTAAGIERLFDTRIDGLTWRGCN